MIRSICCDFDKEWFGYRLRVQIREGLSGKRPVRIATNQPGPKAPDYPRIRSIDLCERPRALRLSLQAEYAIRRIGTASTTERVGKFAGNGFRPGPLIFAVGHDTMMLSVRFFAADTGRPNAGARLRYPRPRRIPALAAPMICSRGQGPGAGPERMEGATLIAGSKRNV